MTDGEKMVVTADADVLGFAGEVVSLFGEFEARRAQAARTEELRLAYLAAEEAANHPDATPEQIEAWRAAEAAYRACPGVFQW